jgi:uncharacterized membrane protein YjjP (DUF1212 family)
MLRTVQDKNMNTDKTNTGTNDAREVLQLLCELSQQLLDWSWEGVAGYEEIVERVGGVYGFEDTTVNMEAQLANIKIGEHVTFVKAGIPGIPILAHTQNLKDFLADIFEGKLSVDEARKALKGIHEKKPPFSPLQAWFGIVAIGVGFSMDIVATWEGIIWAVITGMATGLVFLAADRVKGFAKIAPLTAGLVSGLIVMIAWKFGLTSAAPGLLLIAATFVFIPGDSISTQAYELIDGKWSAGVDRLFYSIIQLVLLVTGAYIAAALTDTSLIELFPDAGNVPVFPWWGIYIGRVFLLIGILYSFQMSWQQFIPALIPLWIITAVAQITSLTFGEIAGAFVATIVGTIIAMFLGRKPRSIPSFVILIPVIFALSPGSHGLRQMEVWVSGATITGINNLTTLAATLFAIAMGILLGRVIAYRWRWMKI